MKPRSPKRKDIKPNAKGGEVREECENIEIWYSESDFCIYAVIGGKKMCWTIEAIEMIMAQTGYLNQKDVIEYIIKEVKNRYK